MQESEINFKGRNSVLYYNYHPVGKITGWRSAFLSTWPQNTVPYHSYRLLFRRFCPLGRFTL